MKSQKQFLGGTENVKESEQQPEPKQGPEQQREQPESEQEQQPEQKQLVLVVWSRPAQTGRLWNRDT